MNKGTALLMFSLATASGFALAADTGQLPCGTTAECNHDPHLEEAAGAPASPSPSPARPGRRARAVG